jgi:deoxynucleoside triphosphate triphosphohydrolase SAMHD1
MHERVYTHKKSKAVEYMVVDALVEADIVQDGLYSNSVSNMEDFMRMDDTILRQIETSRDQRCALFPKLEP